LAMVLAVLQAHCGVSFADRDVYLNVAGGMKINEPAADLAAAAALLSSFANVALPTDRVFFGEVSLSGAVRASSHTGLRLKEADKLGFKDAVLAEAGEASQDAAKMSLLRIAKLRALADQLLPCQ
jgi:DNA repair protein RadA/Sms